MPAQRSNKPSGRRPAASSGRRPGTSGSGSSTRDDILGAARKLFSAKGFDRTTVREIAATAKVDPALINHYFDSKRGLFLAIIALPVDPRDVLAPVADVPDEQIAETILRVLLGVWDSEIGDGPLASFRSGLSNGDESLLRSFLNDVIFATLRERLEGQDRIDLRLGLFATQVAGLVVIRKMVRLEPIADLPPDELAALIGPSLQRYLTGDLP